MADLIKYPLTNVENVLGDLSFLKNKGIQHIGNGRNKKIDGREYEILSSNGAEVVVMTDSARGDINLPYNAKVKLINPQFEPSPRMASRGAYIVPRVWVDDIVEVK